MFERSVSQILLIEDNTLDADLILHALRKVESGVGLSIARDGEEALATFKGWEKNPSMPSVILLDLQLPKINGFEIIKALKSHPRHKHIPVVVLTSSNNRDDILTA
jgi:CheY-like chemotaxis protein